MVERLHTKNYTSFTVKFKVTSVTAPSHQLEKKSGTCFDRVCSLCSFLNKAGIDDLLQANSDEISKIRITNNHLSEKIMDERMTKRLHF